MFFIFFKKNIIEFLTTFQKYIFFSKFSIDFKNISKIRKKIKMVAVLKDKNKRVVRLGFNCSKSLRKLFIFLPNPIVHR